MTDNVTPDPEQLLGEAIEHHRLGELTKAEAGYRAVLRVRPEQCDALHLLGVIAHQIGDSDEAIQQIRNSLAVNPAQPIALNNLGNVFANQGESEEAIESYQRAIGAKPDYAEAYHNLGNVLGDSGKLNEAAESYRRAIDLNPNDAASLVSLAVILEKFGQHEAAVELYRRAIEHEPDSIPAYVRLGATLRKLGRLEEALAVYDQWLKMQPENPIALHLQASCVPDNAPSRASNEYVKTAFDGLAAEFDECLAELDYRVPKLIAAALAEHLGRSPQGALDVVDLGCGTGLCGDALCGHARELVGVDLSPAMLAKADERGVYDRLIEAELTAFLEGCEADYDLIVSADTLIYLGDLGPVFANAFRALRAGGRLVISVEKLLDDPRGEGYRLNAFGRYMHTDDYLTCCLRDAGLGVLGCKDVVLRTEGGQPVAGLVASAVRGQQD